MELRHIYNIAEAITGCITEKSIKDKLLEDVEIAVGVSGVTHYSIDKEFYRMTHNDSTEGFTHTEGTVNATINGVRFVIYNKDKSTTD